MNNLPLFDRAESKRLKEEGMERAARRDYTTEEWLRKARQVAADIATKNGTVTINDVYRNSDLLPMGNTTGSVFKGKAWEFVGMTKSDRTDRHCGTISIWKLRSQQ